MVANNRIGTLANGELPAIPPPNGQTAQQAGLLSPLEPEDVVEQVIKSGAACFENQHGQNYVWLSVQTPKPHRECIPLKSKKFLARLDEMFQSIPVVGNENRLATLKKAVKLLELKALRASRRELNTRIARHQTSVCIDLGDRDWNMVQVNANEWQICSQNHPLFVRPTHLRELRPPVRDGDPLELFKFVPVQSEDEKVLLLSWILSALHPEIPTPILNIVGPQGSAKTDLPPLLVPA